MLRAPAGPLILCSQTLGPGQPWFRAFSTRAVARPCRAADRDPHHARLTALPAEPHARSEEFR